MAQGTRVHVTDLGSLVIIGFHGLQKGGFMRFTSNLSGSYEERRGWGVRCFRQWWKRDGLQVVKERRRAGIAARRVAAATMGRVLRKSRKKSDNVSTRGIMEKRVTALLYLPFYLRLG